MVQLKDDPPEPTEEAELNGIQVKYRRDYMTFLEDQLTNHLPYHDRKKDDYIKRLQDLLYLPAYAEEGSDKLYNEIRANSEILQNLQIERKELMAWLWKYYKSKRRPYATLRECREQIEKLYAGKQQFYDTVKEIEEMLRKLHGTKDDC